MHGTVPLPPNTSLWRSAYLSRRYVFLALCLCTGTTLLLSFKLDLKEIGSEYVSWIYLTQDRDHSESSNESSGSIIKYREFLYLLSDYQLHKDSTVEVVLFQVIF